MQAGPGSSEALANWGGYRRGCMSVVDPLPPPSAAEPQSLKY